MIGKVFDYVVFSDDFRPIRICFIYPGSLAIILKFIESVI